MVVLPEPGGPHRITDIGLVPVTSWRSGAPGASRWSCPTSSSIEAGRIRTASGASGDGGANPVVAPEPEPPEPAAPGRSNSPSSTPPTLTAFADLAVVAYRKPGRTTTKEGATPARSARLAAPGCARRATQRAQPGVAAG